MSDLSMNNLETNYCIIVSKTILEYDKFKTDGRFVLKSCLDAPISTARPLSLSPFPTSSQSVASIRINLYY